MTENTNTATTTEAADRSNVDNVNVDRRDAPVSPPESPTAASEAVTDTTTADSADGDDSGDDSDNHPGRREARYRTQLRAAESERDALRDQVQTLQRAQVDAAIELHGVKAKAVWAAGAELADLLGANGLPDPAKIKAAVTATRSEFGIVKAARPDPTGLKSGAGIPQAAPKGWLTAFAPPRD